LWSNQSGAACASSWQTHRRADVDRLTIGSHDRFQEIVGLSVPSTPRKWFPNQFPDCYELVERLD
jgi:hypothetical protein